MFCVFKGPRRTRKDPEAVPCSASESEIRSKCHSFPKPHFPLLHRGSPKQANIATGN
jgi:hypothetical protein